MAHIRQGKGLANLATFEIPFPGRIRVPQVGKALTPLTRFLGLKGVLNFTLFRNTQN